MSADYQLKVYTEGGETIVRTGEAAPPFVPAPIRITGGIKAVDQYLKIRRTEKGGDSGDYQTVKEGISIVTVDYEGTITLYVNPSDENAALIEGVLQVEPELTKFHINENRTFTKEEFVKLIKFSRLSFDSAEKHQQVLQAFQKLTSTVNISSNDSSDTRGNKERDYVKHVTTNAPTEFVLNLPVYKGFSPKKFRVDVCLDVTDGSARFWLESVELKEIMDTERMSIIYDALKSAEGLVIIYK